ncbi:MAG: hypothetical protein IPQ08_09145 [Chitinophagaceae bacterium]|nr:hypothetical protein [Chitinophagaceae bacterium]
MSDYLCAFNNSPLGKGMFTQKTRGVAQKHLNVGEYSKLDILIPDIKKQKEIMNEIDSRLSVCDKIEESIEENFEIATALRQSILKRAFEGKLSNQDQSDEAASFLLERVQANRIEADSVKSKRSKTSAL